MLSKFDGIAAVSYAASGNSVAFTMTLTPKEAINNSATLLGSIEIYS
jgi:hypothetical protein